MKTRTFLFWLGRRSFAKDAPDGSQAAEDALEEAAVAAAGSGATGSRSIGSKRHVDSTVELAAWLESDRGSIGRRGLEGGRTGQAWQGDELGAVWVVKATGLVGANRANT